MFVEIFGFVVSCVDIPSCVDEFFYGDVAVATLAVKVAALGG